MMAFFLFEFLDLDYYISPGTATSILAFWIVTVFWISSFLYYAQAYLVAAAAKLAKQSHKNCIYLSMFKHLFLSFGSLCFGSILLGITRFVVVVFELFHKVCITEGCAVLMTCSSTNEKSSGVDEGASKPPCSAPRSGRRDLLFVIVYPLLTCFFLFIFSFFRFVMV
jgi:hypothetical protein